MAEATIPIDLRNPGQVFGCLGLMEAVEVILGPCKGAFGYRASEFATSFSIEAPGSADPVDAVVRFLAKASVVALAPEGSPLSVVKWQLAAEATPGRVFAAPEPDSPATLPVRLRADGHELPIEHWLDGDHVGRDNVKFWAGAGGYPGAALVRDALLCLSALGDNQLGAAGQNPFAFSAPMSSSFRFDWRRDYVPLDVGFSPNSQGSMIMVGFPLVELLAAIGLQYARPGRPDRKDKLTYRYGVSNTWLPTVLARAVLGGQGLGLPFRLFRMRLGWPGQEGQARCIIDAQEEFE
jgi:CRISPR-associated protein Csx14